MLNMIMTEDERNMLVERERKLLKQWGEYVSEFYKEKAENVIGCETIKSILRNNGNDYCYKTSNDLSKCINCKGFITNGGYFGYGRRKECFCSSKRKIKERENNMKEAISEVHMTFEEYLNRMSINN